MKDTTAIHEAAANGAEGCKADKCSRQHFWLLYLVCLVEGADLQLLPSTFRALEAEVGLSPSRLAVLGMCQALTQSMSAPFWGSLVDSGWSEKWLLVGGSMSWGILTLLLAGITDWYSMLVLRMLNGIALATLNPVSQVIIARGTKAVERGYYFGLCEFALCMGQLLCAVFATTISNDTVWGFDGWRVAFVIIALASLVLALLLSMLMLEGDPKECKTLSLSGEMDMFWHCCSIRTFRIIVVQGCFGSIPWSALAFTIMFFQYVGVSDFEAAVLFASFLISLGLGNVLGGQIGDLLTLWSRFHGRPLTAQVSVFLGIPMVIWLFVFIPARASSIVLYGVSMCVFGLTASWCKTGVNRPVLTEVVPESSQARILAWLVALEGSVAACLGASLAGLIAERAFGYEPHQGDLNNMPAESRARNTHALAQGMLWMCVVPWVFCFCTYGFLHFTYECDVQNASRKHESSALLSQVT